jgi:amino acid transporter
MKSHAFGFWDLALYTTAMTLSIRWLATAAAAGPPALPMWILATCGFLAPLAIAAAELAGRFEGEGGIYHWARDVFGPFAGFLCGWLYWTCNLPYFSGLFYFIVGASAVAAGPHGEALLRDPANFLALSIALSVGVTLMHLVGLGVGKWLPLAGASAACLLLLLLVGAAATLAQTQGSATDFRHADYAPPLNANGAILWSTFVFAFGGAEGIALLRKTVRGGMPTIVRAIATVGAILAIAYIVGTVAMLAILPVHEASRLSGLPQALQTGFSRLDIGEFAPIAIGLLALSSLGALSAWFGIAARLPFVIGVDRFLPAAFARKSPTTGAPTVAILTQGLIVIVLLVLSQAGATLQSAYDFIVAMSVLSYTLPFLFLFLFAIYFKVQGSPAPAGAWVCPGGPGAARIVALIGLAVSLSAILCTLVPSPEAPDKLAAFIKLIVASGVLVLTGALIYALARRHQRGHNLSS